LFTNYITEDLLLSLGDKMTVIMEYMIFDPVEQALMDAACCCMVQFKCKREKKCNH